MPDPACMDIDWLRDLVRCGVRAGATERDSFMGS
jgi:hypothetical protein